ncbi:MAG TPA: 23S rRNA (adenine(2030)-N(6))-methyltransferase RlmJ [Gammaproteobacteria bacterium]|nr:23S rRNA (adenine(2030)-N(6))-methyltransferase RlmJ [Gammaproteobacteria bacterium]
MNYHHTYHAGNFADVVKHMILIELIIFLTSKSTPFCYIDTHAGLGYYDLLSEFAAKNKEYLNGIEKIIQQEKPPPFIKHYLNSVQQTNRRLMPANYSSLRYYPGSSLIVRQCLRSHDRMIACELQPKTYQSLKTVFTNDKQIAVRLMDGYLALKAFIPPREQRGLVFIDPPYEHPDEFNRMFQILPLILKRWRNGMIMIWYPIKEKTQINRFFRTIKQTIHQTILINELSIYPDLPQHLNGCGIMIINPPWRFDQLMNKILPWLWRVLAINHQGQYRIEYLE